MTRGKIGRQDPAGMLSSRTIHRVKTTQAREEFGTMINTVAYGGQWIVFERRGRAMAALVPIADLERLEALDAQEVARPGWDGLESATATFGWNAYERVRRDLEVDDMH